MGGKVKVEEKRKKGGQIKEGWEEQRGERKK